MKAKHVLCGEVPSNRLHLWRDGADGIDLFNFFTTREYGAESWEPPFEVLRDLSNREPTP